MTELAAGYSPPLVVVSLLLTIYVSSLVYRVLYNLYQHPLSHIPGPKLAAATYLYQTFYGLAGDLRSIMKAISDLFLGDIVRITPDEVHLTNPDSYDFIYSMGSKYAKVTQFYGALGAGYSTFTAGPAEIHRPRRARLDPYFSRRNVLKLEYLVQARAQKLLEIINSRFARDEAVDLHHAFRSISVDVISDYAFGKSYELLSREDLGREFFDLTGGIGPTWWVFQQWPAIQTFALFLPPSLAKKMSEPLKHVLTLLEQSLTQVIAVKAKLDAGEKMEQPCIFEALLTSADGYAVPTPDQVKDESYAILNAASDTTGNAMTVAAYNVVTNPEIYGNLRAELIAAFPNSEEKLEYAKLEKLPYLTGIIREGLRPSFGVPGRLPRVVPEPGASFSNYHLPAGSFVSMSEWDIHQNEKYFPSAQKFDPARWLDPKETRRIEKAFVPFSKGSRSCAGINLAYCEMYVTLGTMFRHFNNLKSNYLTKEDLAYNDYFSGQTPLDATKFHVTMQRG